MTITPADVPCIICGRVSEITMTVEARGVLLHYGSCPAHIEAAAARVRHDSGPVQSVRGIANGGGKNERDFTFERPKPAAPIGHIANLYEVPIGMISNIVETTATEDRHPDDEFSDAVKKLDRAAFDPDARYKRAIDDDDWVNPKTGHGGDCGCIACHMSQTQ